MKSKKIATLLLAFFVLLAISMAACTKAEKKNKSNAEIAQGEGKNITEQSAVEISPVEFPDFQNIAKINYNLYADGKLVDTTYQSIAEKIINEQNKEFLEFLHPLGFKPLIFIIDSMHINPEINDAVKSMQIGERRNITLGKNFFGNRSSELIRTMPRFAYIPRKENVSIARYFAFTGKEPEVGDVFAEQFWNASVIKVENNTVFFERLPEEKIITSNFGNMSISYNETTIVLELLPEINKTTVTDSGFLTPVEANATDVKFDMNHPFAGKNIVMEIELLEKGEKRIWSRDINDALNSDFAIVFFYNFTCAECGIMERNIFLSPLLLSNIDEISFVKINGDIEKEIAKDYGVATYPEIVFFRNGEEQGRIKGFINTRALLHIIKSMQG